MSQIAIYARKSTESEDRQILSIDSQIKELLDFAKSQNLKIDRVVRESMSAKSPGRPIFNEMMMLVQKGKLDEILCWKLDRLARNPVDGGALIWAIEESKLKNIHTPQRTFVNTGNDKFWMQLEFGMAKKYVDDLSDNVKRGMRARANLGWSPGIPPLGYVNDQSNKTIVKDKERFLIVRKMWDLMLSGTYSPHAIVIIATDRWGLRTRKFNKIGGGPLSYSAVYKLFTNPFYYGLIRYDGQYYQGAHKAMITKAEFARVQQLLGLAVQPRPNSYFFPFTGLIKCGECGASITAENKTNRQGHKYVYYHCTKRKRSIKCAQKVIEKHNLEVQITSFLDSISITNEFKKWAIDIIKKTHAEQNGKNETSIAALRRRSDSCRIELNELLNMKLRGLMDDAEYVAKKNDLANEHLEIKELLADSDNRHDNILTHCEDAFDFASTAKKKFAEGSPEVRRAILDFIGSNLILKDGILRIEPKKPLFFIHQALQNPAAKNYMFEPLNIRQVINKKQRSHAGFSTWLTAIQEVRTFYWEHRLELEFLKLPSILKSIMK